MAPREESSVLRKRAVALLAGLLAGGSAVLGTAPSSGAQVTTSPSGAQIIEVSGGAFGHYTKVSLFGGPSVPVGPLPDVRLPPGGSEQPIVAREAAGSAVYGPAHIFAGVWPADVPVAPPSGPITVSTRGTPGPGGSVTSTVSIVLRDPPDPKSPGGWGPLPPTQGDELHTTCTANESGVTGSTRLVNAVMSKSTTPAGEPLDEEPIPNNPPVNYTREGVLTNVGDRYRIVYNEHIIEPDGSLTVNGVHMYLLGDIAIGESIIGQVRCSAKGAAFANTPPSIAPPPESAPFVSSEPFTGSETAAPAEEEEEEEEESGTNFLPFVIVGALVIGGALAAFALRSRRGA